MLGRNEAVELASNVDNDSNDIQGHGIAMQRCRLFDISAMRRGTSRTERYVRYGAVHIHVHIKRLFDRRVSPCSFCVSSCVFKLSKCQVVSKLAAQPIAV